MKSNFEISAWAMGQNQPKQDCHNLGKYIHAQFLPKIYMLLTLPGDHFRCPVTYWDPVISFNHQKRGWEWMWLFSNAQVSVVRRTNSSVGRSGNQEYKEKALWEWGWIWEVGKEMGKGEAMEENSSAKCQRRDRSVVRGNALAEECQTCKKCFDTQKRLSFLANQLKGCGRGCERVKWI